MNLFLTTVTSYDANTGNYFIRMENSSFGSEKGVQALLLNPVPTSDGGGFKSAPAVPRDTLCLAAKEGFRYYILGFIQNHGLIVGGEKGVSRPINPGDVLLTHNTGARLGITEKGTIILQTQKWAQLAINQLTKKLTAWFKNLRINLWSAFVEYVYDSEKEGGMFRIIATKYPQTRTPNPTGHNTMITPDRFILKAGSLGDKEDHLIELEIEQGFPGPAEALSKHKSTTKIGRQEDKYFEHMSRIGVEGASTNLLVEATNDSKLHLNLDRSTAQKSIDIVLDVEGENAFTCTVNEAATITVRHTGDVVVKTKDGAGIFLGGEEKAQQLATKTWVQQVYSTHVHTNGNQGAPTGTVLIDNTQYSLSQDSATQHFTFTTKAE